MATLHRVDGAFDIPDALPVIALRDLVYFPYMVVPLLVGRPPSVAALAAAEGGDGFALLVAQRDPAVDSPGPEDLFQAGTVIRVLRSSRLADGTARVVMEGLGRAAVEEWVAGSGDAEGGEEHAEDEAGLLAGEESGLRAEGESGLRARVQLLASWERETEQERAAEAAGGGPELAGLVEEVESAFRRYVRMSETVSDQVSELVAADPDKVRRSLLMAGHLLVGTAEKQELLEAPDWEARYQVLREILVRENEILRVQAKLDAEIGFRLEGGAGVHPFDDPLGALRRPAAEGDPEWAELEQTIEKTPLPAHAKDRVEKEFKRLRKLSSVAPEASVIRTYLDWILALPWENETRDNLDVKHAAAVLEEEHHGLEEVKERVLDHIAVLSLVGKLQGPILCLVGPPGVGKTSLGRSIARCLDREFVRVSLGGVRDEAEIRGHRRTYVGALPGRVVQGMRKGGARNPVFLLDEVDKLARDFHGDPGAALLEVLDPEQNRAFTDHYLELEFDLSDVLFVATANTLGGVPAPLRDRMEVIRLPGYLDTEKRIIARRFIWPRQVERHGLGTAGRGPGAGSAGSGSSPRSPGSGSSPRSPGSGSSPRSPGSGPEITEEAVQAVVARYTREAGVRELERRLSRIARKLARAVAAEGAAAAPSVVEEGDLRELLGPPPRRPPRREEGKDRSGIACGLAWTAAGGEVLEVEVAAVAGSGKIQLTGTLGDVMKESAFAAVTYARSRARRLGLPERFHKELDIHIHIPEGATPKDGPSAGITIAVALISALTDAATRADVAMTGEITLRGRVLAVGGIKEKAVAALRGGIKRVLLPAANAPDIEQLPEEVRSGVEMVPLDTMDEVLGEALARPRGRGVAREAREGREARDGVAGAAVQARAGSEDGEPRG